MSIAFEIEKLRFLKKWQNLRLTAVMLRGNTVLKIAKFLFGINSATNHSVLEFWSRCRKDIKVAKFATFGIQSHHEVEVKMFKVTNFKFKQQQQNLKRPKVKKNRVPFYLCFM